LGENSIDGRRPGKDDLGQSNLGQSNLGLRLARLVAAEGPLPISHYMAACLFDPTDGYYARGAGLGRDFTTAPEISQMFGELIGLWAVQSWTELGAPDAVQLLELGPGRGVLMADAWRAAGAVPGFRAAASLRLIEASEPLRREQAGRLRAAGAEPHFLDRLEQAPAGPLLLIANEFLDCLPIRQFVRARDGWRERLVGLDADAGSLVFGLAAAPLASDSVIPPALRDASEGAVVEIRPGAEALLAELAARLHAFPGRALFIDYGSASPQAADTLQAIAQGAKVHPLQSPGLADLTAWVDFASLAVVGRALRLEVAGPRPQGAWLEALGVRARAARLAAANPARREELNAALDRLTAPDQMGELFQAICFSSPGLPLPAGF